ncbi:MAG: alpha-ketoglutarate-dependent dioxygenase AlkB [Candidatus Kapabacteria bacterium]|nr:alpha-ketoglutarate-dependent dioxygenase AlkB [Candidatus Kapabacteria bacterium]
MMSMNLLPCDGIMTMHDMNVDDATTLSWFKTLLQDTAWRDETITMFGRQVMQPRRTALYGDDGFTYRYSGRTMRPLPWTPTLLKLKDVAEQHADTSFTTVLLNLYRNGADSMGWHRDNERELGVNPVIASISLGATRMFQCKHRSDPSQRLALPLHHSSVLVMKGAMQEHWYHRVPKERGVAEPRINLTFRTIVGTGGF